MPRPISGQNTREQLCNILKYAADKDRKPFVNDLKTIYQARPEEAAEKWTVKYPNSMKSLEQNRDAILPIFKFYYEVRKAIYTTNAIESLNSTYRRLNRQRSVFPSDTALLKALYLVTFMRGTSRNKTVPEIKTGETTSDCLQIFPTGSSSK